VLPVAQICCRIRMKIFETKNRFKKDAETHSSSLHRGWTFWKLADPNYRIDENDSQR